MADKNLGRGKSPLQAPATNRERGTKTARILVTLAVGGRKTKIEMAVKDQTNPLTTDLAIVFDFI